MMSIISQFPCTELRRFWMGVFLLSGVILLTFCIGIFLACYFTSNLNWTILVSNFCLITITMFSGLYLTRVRLAVVGLREEEQRVALLESILIIRELCESQQAERSGKQTETAQKFLQTLTNAEAFARPQHIEMLVIRNEDKPEIEV